MAGASGDAMNAAHHDAPTWKATLSSALNDLLSDVDNACLKVADAVSRALHRVANLLSPPQHAARP
jgi:hypothetical protein